MTDGGKPLLQRAYSLTSVAEARALYDDWAETYDSELVAENGYVAPRLLVQAFLVRGATADLTVIDVGCGTGLAGQELAAHGFRNIDGLDLSAGMLAAAKAKGVYRSLFQADLTKPGVDALVAPESYDAAISVGTFTHQHVGPDGIDVVLRMIRPGGLMVFTVNADAYREDGYAAKLRNLDAGGAGTLLGDADSDYIPKTGVRGRTISLRKAG